MIDAIPWIIGLVLLDLGLLWIARRLQARKRFEDVDELARRKR